MKKTNLISALLFFVAVAFTATPSAFSQTCNQVEILYATNDCYKRTSHEPGGGAGPGKACMETAACVNQLYNYSSSVTGAGWTYNWTVSGPSAVSINPSATSPNITIVWPQTGIFILTLTATDPSGNVFTYCLKINVKEKPIANFTFTPNNVCAGSTINFTGTTTFSGSFISSWNFGDPASGGNNYVTVGGNTPVSHQYNAPGTYTVTLITYSFETSGGGGAGNEPPSIKTCCADTITKTVTITPGTLKIECVSTVCPGDTVKYNVVGCSAVTWLPVIGGSMVASTPTSITIVWGNGNPQGQIQAQCPGGCIASVSVPIIPSNPVIAGNNSPCKNATSSYTLPVLPGTFYTWTLTNISTNTNYNNLINTYPDNNTVWINWAVAPPGTYQLSVQLENKHICCSSSGSITITPTDKWTAYFDQTVCSIAPGNVANLSVFPSAGTFNWSVLPPNAGVTPLTGTGPVFNPSFTIPGTYYVQVTETANTYCNSGASNPQQIKINVISTPAPGVINGPATVCTGTSYTYTMSTPAPAGYHYYWSITGGAATFEPGSLANATGNSATIQWTTLPGTISVVLQANGYPPCPSAPVTFNVSQATVGSVSGTMNVCVDDNGTYTLSGGTLPPGEPVTWSITPSSQGTIISGQGTSTITILWHGTTGAGPWNATINASTSCGNATALSGIQIFPKFTVGISKSGTDICQPGGVTLTVTGAPSGATYLWSPGGQTTPSISGITAAGTYTVTVTKGGCSATATYIVENPFEIKPAMACFGTCNAAATNWQLGVNVIKPLTGTFTYQWYTGTYPTGTSIAGANTNAYLATAPGNYYVVVTYGNCQLYESFIVPKICCPDVNNPQITSVVRNSCNSFTFTATTANPHNAPITWDFGNGVTMPGQSGVPITYTYPPGTLPGDYCVKFCVGPPSPNAANCIGNCATTTVRIPVLAGFIYKLGCNGCLQLTNLSKIVPTSNAATATYVWNFGDGSPVVTTTSPTPPNHCYTSTTPQTYTITLTINYSDPSLGLSCSSTATQTVNYAPLAINVNPSPVCVGVPSTFNIAGSPSFAITTYTWNFGDGFTAYTPSSTHIYNSAGTFNASLSVTDELGNTCTAISNIVVQPGISSCTIQPGFICPGGAATLTAPNISGASYLWEVETSPGNWSPAPGTNNLMTYTTTVPGFYHVVITGPNGCTCTSNRVEVKAVNKPKAIISVAPSSKICGPGPVFLTSTNHLSGYTSEWYANGNYNTLLSSNMIFVTGVSATTVFNLVLTNEYGCKDTCSLTVTVNPVPAPPVITSSPTLCEGVPITLSVTNYSANISWNTGANTTSIVVFSAGTYTATYTDPVTGCTSSSSINVKKRPSADLFPHFCNTIPCTCRDTSGHFTIYAPKPLVGAYASNYTIQWFFNGNPVGGNTPTFTPAVSGTYHIVVTDPLTGCKDTSETYTIQVPPCDTCDCKESKWTEIILTEGEKTAVKTIKATTLPPGTQKLECGKLFNLTCNQPYTINAGYQCKDTTCPPKVTYSLLPPGGPAINGNAPFTFTPSQSGVYVLTLYGWCGNKICDSCIIEFRVDCKKECDCKGSKWESKVFTIQEQAKPIDCNKTYPVPCNQPVTVQGTYNCPDPANCPANVTYTLQPPAGSSVTGTAPLTFTPSQTGSYIVTLYGWCGNKICDSCQVVFKTECPKPDSTCCPYKITVNTTNSNITYNAAINASVLTQNFSISGLAGVPLTEIRAEVVSYSIQDNFNKECMKCVNLPYTWGSVQSATVLGSPPASPAITMFNTTQHPFNPTGSGQYKNPREVVWSNGSTFMVNNNTPVSMNFLLPAPPAITCCELRGKICVKFTFRDNNCKECEVIKCFDFHIKSK